MLIIKDGVKKLEELSEHIYDVNVNFNLRTDFNTMSLEDLADAHKKVVEMEKGIQIIENFYRFYRGLLYVAAHNMCDENQFLQWIEMQNVSKTTVYRYMAFCTLIMRFPRLIICDLNFSQLLKHKERIISFMGEESNSKLAHQLAEPVEFRVGGTRIVINASDSEIPHIAGITFHTDWKIIDSYGDVDLSGIAPMSAHGATEIADESIEQLENYITKL